MPSMNRTIKTGFWKSPYIKKLQPLLKFVYLFLICGEPSSETSLYPFPLDFYAPHLGLTTEELKKSIQELEKTWICDIRLGDGRDTSCLLFC